MLLMNAVAAFKEELMKISCMFPRARITIGHIPGDMNPADSLTKLYKDPVSAINSMIYRFGPQSFGSRAALEQDVVATCENGVFTYLGLPAKFLTEDKGEKERCNFCQEEYKHCALVMTRAQSKAEQEEDWSSSDDSQSNPANNSQKRLLRAWAKRVKGLLHIGSGNNLLDHQYNMKLSLTLERRSTRGGPVSSSPWSA